MITSDDINVRSNQLDLIVELANELLGSNQPVRSCDPIQVWEKHPVVSKYLEDLRDREIVAAIDAVWKFKI